MRAGLPVSTAIVEQFNRDNAAAIEAGRVAALAPSSTEFH